MPEVAPKTSAARARHVLMDTHPLDTEGNLGLTPDNFITNGDLTEFDQDGNPVGIEIGRVEARDGIIVYAGTQPHATTVQNTAPLPVNRASYLQNGPLIQGRYPLASDLTARIPKPPKPVLRKVSASRTGFNATTTASPLFIAFGWNISGFRSPPGLATPFQVGQGQGVRAIMPDTVPQHVTGIDIYLSAPGRSTPTNPGKLYLQRTVPVGRYMSSFYDLNGPFRDDDPEPTTNETMLGYPVAPWTWPTYNRSSGIGVVQAAIQYSTVFGTTPVGALSAPHTITNDYTALAVMPANPPIGVTGYRVFVVKNNRWFVAVDTLLGGAESFRPLSKPWDWQVVSGSTGDQASQETDETGAPTALLPPSRYLMSEAEPERVDTSGIAAPESPAAEPIVIGSSLPAPGPLYFRVADTARGLEGPVSDYEYVDLALGEMAQVFLPQPANSIPNPEYAEIGSDGRPLGHEVTEDSRIMAEAAEGELIVRSEEDLTADLLLTRTAAFSIQTNLGGVFEVPITVEGEMSGGDLVTVIEQLDAGGNVVQSNDVDASSQPGQYLHKAELLPTTASASDDSDRMGSHSGTTSISISTNTYSVRIYQRVRIRSGSVSSRVSVRIGGSVFQRFRGTPVYYPPQPPPPPPPRYAWEANAAPELPPVWKPPPRRIPVPGGITSIEPPDPVIIPGETQTLPDLDRPWSNGSTVEALNFDNGRLSSGKNLLTRNQATVDTDLAELYSYWDGNYIFRDTAVTREGYFSARVDTSTVVGDGHGNHGMIYATDSMPALPAGTSVVCSTYVLMPAGRAFRVMGRPATATNGYLSENSGTTSHTGTGGWQRVETQPWTVADQSFRPGFQILIADTEGATVFWTTGGQVEVKSTVGATEWEPPPWITERAGGAGVAVEAAAAASGGYGMRCRKAAASATPAKAFIHRDVRGILPHSFFEGLSSRFFLSGQRPLGTFDFNELRRSDGSRYAWLRFSNAPEVKKINVTKQPSATGTLTLGLEGKNHAVEARSDYQVETLNITAPPTSIADITLNLGGVAHRVPVGGRKEVKVLTIAGHTNHTQTFWVYLDQWYDVQIFQWDGAHRIAERIANRGGYNGYTVYNSGTQVIFTATSAGNRSAGGATTSTSYVPAYWHTQVVGAPPETVSSLATKLRTTPFAGWDVSGSGSQVIFSSRATGARPAATFAAGTSGVGASFAAPVLGGQDTTAQVAQKIRDLVISGWAITGSGDEIILTATTSGDKGPISLNTIGTGVEATVRTTRPGGNGDILAFHKNEDGVEVYRRIIRNMSTTEFTNVDLVVSGAGTNQAAINVWSSTGNAPKTLTSRHYNVNLLSHPAERTALGITAESDPAMTWDFYIDSVNITDRGETYFREHNARGRVVNQLVGRYLPSQPLSQELLINGIRMPVLPGYSYSLGAFARFDNLPAATRAKPLSIDAYRSDGEIINLGQITDGTAMVGSLPWAEYKKTVLVPAACYEIRIQSKDISSGLFKMQEIACSIGSRVLRTHRYATYGTFRATLNKEVARRAGDISIDRRRKTLGTRVTVPTNASANMTYRSFDDSRFPQNEFFSNPDLVPDRAICEVNGELRGDGSGTPIVHVGSPYLEYVLMAGAYELSTLLRPDRSELPGGVILTDVEEWTSRPKVDVTRTFRNRVRRHKLASGIGHQPPCQIQLFSPEGKAFVEEQWGPPNIMKIEALGWLLDVVLTEQPDLKRGKGTLKELPGGGMFASYKGPLAVMEVVDARPFATPFG